MRIIGIKEEHVRHFVTVLAIIVDVATADGVLAPAVVAQAASPSAAMRKETGRTARKSAGWKFAVVSIRRNTTGGQQKPGRATPDGYRQENLFLAIPLLNAYVPQTGSAYYTDDQVIGAPAWLYGDNDHYDIDAKIDPADLTDWRDPAKQPAMLRSMLQSMLAERLKLVVHRSTKESPIYSLVVGKAGPKFEETDPNRSHPVGLQLPGSGQVTVERKDGLIVRHYWSVTIGQLAATLFGSAGRPVQDQTGLSGKYDCTISMPLPDDAPSGTQQEGASDPQSLAFSAAEQLGLKLEPAKGEVETLVIDHVERPSQN